MPDARLNLRRLAIPLLLGVIVPVSLALMLDLALDTLPVATIFALVIFMPLGGIWLGRVMVTEFNRVLDEVAPEDDPRGDGDGLTHSPD